MEVSFFMQTFRLSENCSLHIHPTEKFKDVTMNLDFFLPLESTMRPAHFLLSFLLAEVCDTSRTKLETQKRLDDLYGASLSVTSDPRGNLDLLEFSCSTADSHYVSDSLLYRQMEVLRDYACWPYLENGLFESHLFEECVQKAITAVRMTLDDPSAAAVEEASLRYGGAMKKRCLPSESELCCVTNEACTSAWKELIDQAEIHLFVLGNVDADECLEAARSLFSFSDRNTMVSLQADPETRPYSETILKKPISQSVLVQLYEDGLRYQDPLMPAFMLGNGILGALPTSLLFQEVREARSLCYSIGSENLIYDGMLRITAGMNRRDLPEAGTLIAQQISRMQKGEFSDDQLETARSMYINSWRGSMDHGPSLIWDDCRSVLFHTEDSIPRMIHRFETVTREDIMNAYAGLKLAEVLILEEDADDPS